MAGDDRRRPPPEEAGDSSISILEDLDDFEDDFADDSFLEKVARAPEVSWGPQAATEQPSFRGTKRFVVEALLGSGGFGDVYRVLDRERGVHLALKHLRKAQPRWLYRFKREFRALAKVVHPNLVTLFDLSTDSTEAFFTMELIPGDDLLTYVRPEALDVDRLRASLLQLAEGVGFLHRARKVHRDLKPSNVLVTPAGRVVILDFGLISDLGLETYAGVVAGTPGYMSPEQAAGTPVSGASDWYSVGVMLFEALTGRLPFQGTSQEILERKRVEPSPSVRTLSEGVSDDLVVLCDDLLQRDPALRPHDAEILDRLRSSAPIDIRPLEPTATPTDQSIFQGRAQEIAVLSSALDRSAQGRVEWVVVHGGSGMGKTALLDRFLAQVRQDSAEAIILRGTCYERESVPYKALDGVIDELSAHLRGLEATQASLLLRDDVAALSPLFPVLGLFETESALSASDASDRSSREGFHEAAIALRALLVRLGASAPVVIMAIDDLQWGDFDSAELIAEVLDSASLPPLLLITCHRTEETETNPVLLLFAQWRERLARAGRLGTTEISIQGLGFEEARELALSLLGEHRQDAAELASAIATEAAGSPFFVDELSRHGVLATDVGQAPSVPNVTRAVTLRVTRLPAEAKRILEVVAVSGRPIATSTACEAAGLDVVDPAALATLRAGRLVRIRVGEQREELECYHDRVRQSVLADFAAPALRERNLDLARAFEQALTSDPERVATHYRDGGEPERAATYMLEAAERASSALAFERAARLYREALEIAPQRSPAERRALKRRIGDSLANAGRGNAAASVYREAAEGASVDEQIDLRIRAAEQMLRGGPPLEGIDAAREAMRAIGVPLPRTRFGMIVGTLYRRLRVWMRGHEKRPPESQLASDVERARIDAAWFFGNAILGLDPILGLYLQSEGLLRAQRRGSTEQLVRCLSTEAALYAQRPSGRAKASAIYARAESLLQEVAPEFRAYLLTAKTAMSAGMAHFDECADASREAEQIYRHKLVGRISEATMVRFFHLISLFYNGAWGELSEAYARFRHDCAQRDDLFWHYLGEVTFGWIEPALEDDAGKARAGMVGLVEMEKRVGMKVAHGSPLLARGWIERCGGDWAAAWKSLDDHAKELRRAGGGWITVLEMRLRMERSTAALGAIARGALNGRQLRRIRRSLRRDVRRLERMPLDAAVEVARLCRAGMAALEGDAAGSVEILRKLAARLSDLGYRIHAAAVRRRLGKLVGGADGRELVNEADAYITAQGARSPERIADLLVAGWPELDR